MMSCEPGFADAIRTLLLDPVRRQFEARLAEIEAQVEALGHEQGHSVLQQAASLLRELVALQHRNERFRLAAAGTLRSQWQTLLGESTPAASLAWMDTPVGGTLMAEAVARYDWTLQDVEPIAARILATAVMAAENSQAAFDTRLIAIGRLSARVERAVEELTAAQGPVTGKNHNPLAEIAELLYGVRAEGEAVAAGRVKLRAAIDDLTALRPDTVSSGVLRPSTWRDVVAKLSMIRDREQMALRQQSVNSLGPLFGPDGRVAPEVVSAPDVLKQAVDNGFIDHRERRMPDVGALAMLDGVPDAALISAAAERLRWLQRWVETSALQLSSTIRQPVSSFVVSRAVRASAIDIAEAYGNAKAVSGGVAAFPADAAADLTFALSQIARRSEQMGADLAWLVGVRTHRELEVLDAAFERRNVFALGQVIRAWDGRRPLLAVNGWQTRADRRARMVEGWRRVTETARQAAPLVHVLDTPPVRGALAPTRLVRKWRGLVEAATSGDEGYREFDTYVEKTLVPFSLVDCPTGARGMARPFLSGGPLDDDLSLAVDALEKRCKELLDVPVPQFKPASTVKNRYKQLPW